MSFYKIHFNLPSFLCIILTSCVLISCSSNQPSKRSKISEKTTTTQQIETSELSADELIKNAQELPVDEASNELISASEQLLIEEQYHQAIWLAHQLLALTDDSVKKMQLLLIKLQGLITLQQAQIGTEVLTTIEELQQEHSIEESLRYLTLKQELLALRDDVVSSVDVQLQAFAKNNDVTDSDLNFLWQRLSQLSSWQVEQLALRNPPYFKGWQQLINFAFKFGDNNDTFQRYLTQWQRSYPTHPGNVIIQQLQASLVNSQINNIENIAIILPLTGKQGLAGKVAQQGILAAFDNDSGKTLHFIDAELLDITQLSQQLLALNIDYVIGPLLRENVDAYLALEELTIPTLLLNIPSEYTLKAHQVAFSMRPEDEAIQAATTLSNKKFKHPLILSHQDNLSQRITQTFINTWQKITSTTPDVVYFDRDKNMQNVLKTSLEVQSSEARINRIKSRIKLKIDSEPRNRRDIDMIYVVGAISETRLLKPFIDVNISPFAKRIPVYASSRSHSAQTDASDSRDLSGLIFTEMPWLLSSTQQNASLHQLSRKLWPNRSDGLERIFAMGYDSLSLINKIFVMQEYPYVRHFGQTGILQLNTNNILSRSLLWGKYQNDKAEEIAMDRE